jgi:hypothetical protein
MEPLPAGYRTVGGLSLAYALIMAGFITLAVLGSGIPPMKDPADWFVALTLVVTPLPLLVGGFLLCSNQAAPRATAWILFIAGLLLLLKAFAVTVLVHQALTHPKGSTAGLAVLLVPAIIMPASIWGTVVLFAGVLLERRVRGPI